MVMPIILFPSALISSFAGMTIPELAECAARGHTRRIRYISERVLQLSLIFSIGVSGILICYSHELGQVIYSSDEASLYIRLLAPLVPVMYLDSTTDAMLKGLGEQLYSMNVNIIDALISVILVWLLLPIYGIEGYIFIIFLMELINFGLSASRLAMKTGLRPQLFKWVVKPVFCTVIATLISHFLFNRVFPRQEMNAAGLTLHIAATVVIYVALVRLTGTFDREDSAWLASVFKG
jgi:stage V sporulation protein B